MTPESLVNVLEAALLAAGRALTLEDFLALFVGSSDAPDRKQLRDALAQLEENLSGRGIELVEVASGYRLQVRKEYSSWLAGLFSERPPRYSRALLETLALIAYRQPITRGEIEDVRGVAVSSNIIKTLMEREWIRVLGHREVPGRPALYGTSREFLDHFGLKSLEGLPPLADIRDLDQVAPDLFAPAPSDANDSQPQDDEGKLLSPEGVAASSGNDAGGDEPQGEDGAEGQSAAGETAIDNEVAEESVVGESAPDVSSVTGSEASLDLGTGDVATGTDDDSSLSAGQSDASGGDSQGEVGNNETTLVVDQSADANAVSVASQSAAQDDDERDDDDRDQRHSGHGMDDTDGHIGGTDRGELDGRR